MQVITTSSEIEKSISEKKEIKLVFRNPHKGAIDKDLHFIIATDVLSNDHMNLLNNLVDSIQISGFIILEETVNIDMNKFENINLQFVAQQTADNRNYILLKKKQIQSELNIIRIIEDNFSWLDDFKANLNNSESMRQSVLFVSQGEKLQGKIHMYDI